MCLSTRTLETKVCAVSHASARAALDGRCACAWRACVRVPQLLAHGTISKAVDVYSFGVLLWQMYSGSRPWSGLTHAQIIFKVRRPARPPLPPATSYPPPAPSPHPTLPIACLLAARAPSADARPLSFSHVRPPQVVQERQRLHWGADALPVYRQLAEACMAYDPQARPGFAAVVETLDALRSSLME